MKFKFRRRRHWKEDADTAGFLTWFVLAPCLAMAVGGIAAVIHTIYHQM